MNEAKRLIKNKKAVVESDASPREDSSDAEILNGEDDFIFREDDSLILNESTAIDDGDSIADAEEHLHAEGLIEDTEVADDIDDSDDDDDDEVMIYDADAEDVAEAALAARAVMVEHAGDSTAELITFEESEIAFDNEPHARSIAELMSIVESLIFVSEEPLSSKTLGDVLTEDRSTVELALDGLKNEYDERGSGLMLREIAGGYQIVTRPEHHEYVRQFLKSQPSAKLSLPALETLAVIAYKQPVTVPEILEIRGVQSTSAIKTLLDKRLIVAKGRKETVGRPMMYGTSKEFLMQFGLRDLTELPSIEDFEDLAGNAA